ncbi:ankyrin repeat-containing domain protein [Apiospora kogelbergensis]|uniref:ankyrin repeat-containing domain protein n=1 Tax=Apiospora kogelbergensis TaxID=1337665 RepID=UPI00312E9AE2
MSLQDCPIEILQRILQFSALARGIRRALRLKLVCKLFYNAFQPALFQSRLLDILAAKKRLTVEKSLEKYDPKHRRGNGAGRLWHTYAVMRVNADRDPAVSRLAQVRLVVSDFCERTGRGLEESIIELCRFARSDWFKDVIKNEDTPNAPVAAEATTPAAAYLARKDLHHDLLSIASYYGDALLVRELLDATPDFRGGCHLFHTPMYMAAYAGHKDVLLLLQEHMPEWGKRCSTSLRGAARRGQTDMLQLAMNPPSSNPASIHDNHGTIRYQIHCTFLNNLPTTVEGIEFVRLKILQNSSFVSILKRELSRHAGLGNLDMVRYFLDQGADVRGEMRRGHSPLREAIRHGHEDVVDLLVERGADVNQWEPLRERKKPRRSNPSAIVAAVQSGSLAMLRKVLDLGAVLDAPSGQAVFFSGPHALTAAVALEHTAMVELLLEMGAADLCWPFYQLNPEEKHRRKWPLERARERGLDSMEELLGQKGITMASMDTKQ